MAVNYSERIYAFRRGHVSLLLLSCLRCHEPLSVHRTHGFSLHFDEGLSCVWKEPLFQVDHKLRFRLFHHTFTHLVGMVQHWILKSQPAEYSVTDLQRTGTGCWNEVRNYQARNLMQELKDHDTAFFYHSGCPDAGIYGLMNITSGPYPDETARHKGSKYFDQRAADGNNPWVCVDVELVRRYEHPLLIPQLNALGLEYHPKRLSVIKISDEQFERIKAELEAHNRT